MSSEEFKSFVRTSEARRYEVVIDGESFVGDFLLVEVMNLGFNGTRCFRSRLSATRTTGCSKTWCFLSAKDRLVIMNRWLEMPDDKPAPVTVRRGRRGEVELEAWTCAN